MKRNWLLDELTEHFTFLPSEMQREKQDWALRSSSNFSIRSAFPLHKFEVLMREFFCNFLIHIDH